MPPKKPVGPSTRSSGRIAKKAVAECAAGKDVDEGLALNQQEAFRLLSSPDGLAEGSEH
jgi:hypothetical protein